MPRAKIDLEPYRAQISSWVLSGVTQEEVLARLKQEGINTTDRTLSRRLRKWNIPLLQPKMKDTPELRQRVTELFWSVNLPDEDTVAILQVERYQITKSGLQRLRWKLGLLRRLPRDKFQQTRQEIEQQQSEVRF